MDESLKNTSLGETHSPITGHDDQLDEFLGAVHDHPMVFGDCKHVSLLLSLLSDLCLGFKDLINLPATPARQQPGINIACPHLSYPQACRH